MIIDDTDCFIKKWLRENGVIIASGISIDIGPGDGPCPDPIAGPGHPVPQRPLNSNAPSVPGGGHNDDDGLTPLWPPAYNPPSVPPLPHHDGCTCWQCAAYDKGIAACDDWLAKNKDAAGGKPLGEPKKIKFREFL